MGGAVSDELDRVIGEYVLIGVSGIGGGESSVLMCGGKSV